MQGCPATTMPGMDVSPKTLREVEFREKMRGYHPEDVDQFLEQVAAGLEVLQDRLRQAVERAQRAEAAAAESSGAGSASDETLRRTLVLAQRTADMAVQEAREQAARILAGAEQQAQGLLADTEERVRRTHDEALSGIRAELGALEASRQRAQAEIDAMYRWIDDHRVHLTASLKDALSAVERAGSVAPPPASTPIDLPRPAPVPHAAIAPQPAPGPVEAGEAGRQAGPGEGVLPSAEATGEPGPETAMWTPGPEDFSEPTGEVAAVPAGRKPVIDVEGLHRSGPERDPDEQALDDFFDDADYADDRRFGGRLRRRR